MYGKAGEWLKRRGKVSEFKELRLDGSKRGRKGFGGEGGGAWGFVTEGEGSALVRLADGSVSSTRSP